MMTPERDKWIKDCCETAELAEKVLAGIPPDLVDAMKFCQIRSTMQNLCRTVKELAKELADAEMSAMYFARKAMEAENGLRQRQETRSIDSRR